MIKRLTAAVVALTLLMGVVSGCTNGNKKENEEETTVVQEEKKIVTAASTDNYRNYYEIFVYAFCDSDGDGIGDINGLISKLDYLNDGNPEEGNDLGVDGIWLMPITKANGSVHKYDVMDYKAIDEDYGTMEDFEKLIEECDKRGIKVIIDLVINHTSANHPWYHKAALDVLEGADNGYGEYYNFVHEDDRDSSSKYKAIYGYDYAVEANFINMLDLNLSSEKVREEILDIVQFWVDKGVGGFRLDAIKHYEESGGTDGVEFMKWLNDEAKKIDEDIYFVGENWDTAGEISKMYESGIDSQFNFPISGITGKVITSAGSTDDVNGLLIYTKKWQESIRKRNENAIDAPFLSNHDTSRIAGSLNNDLTDMKMAASLYMFMPGNPFIYYGEEIGMSSADATEDYAYRVSMPWSFTDMSDVPEDLVVEKLWPEKSVEEQLADEDSLPFFYSNIIKLKLQNPEIARGTIEEVINTRDDTISGYRLEYNGESVIVMHNLSDDEKTVEISKDNYEYTEIRGQLAAVSNGEKDGKKTYPEAALDGTKLTMPGKSTLILK